ncbi:MAG: COG1361 S-layer family protein [Haloplanus sp.]
MRPGARLVVALVVLSLVGTSALAGPAVVAAQQTNGQVVGWPRLSVESATPALEPGTETSLALRVVNDPRLKNGGPPQYEARVTTARGVSLTVDDGGVPFDVEEETVPVGDVPQGSTALDPLSVTVPDGTPPGTYRLPVTISYSGTRIADYDQFGVEYAEFTDRVRTHVTVRVRSRARFAVVDTDSATQVGEVGTVGVTLANVGSAPARNARVELVAPAADVRVGGTGAANASVVDVGSWPAGDRRTVNFTVVVDDDAESQPYALEAYVVYEDADGIARRSSALPVGVRPAPKQTFAVTDLRSDLRVDRTGTVSGVVVNTGTTTVRNPALVFEAPTDDLRPNPPVVGLPDLAPGERANFSFDVTVPESAVENDQQVRLTVEYRTDRGRLRRSDPIERTVAVAPERDRFSVTPVDATFEIDTDNRLTVRIENADDVPLRDVQATIDVGPPFESDSAAAYAGSLAPGESAVVAFEVTVSDNAVAATAPVAVNVTAERPDGKTVRSGPYVVPVTVTESSGPSDAALLVGGLVVVALILGAGWWWLGR